MKKAEMEEHSVRYKALMAEARSAEQKGLYREAIDVAMSAWDYIDGMMQFGLKYENKTFSNISAIETVLRCAPVLLDFKSLNALEDLLETCRRIERDSSHSVAHALAQARALMWQYHRLWDHLEKNPDIRQDELATILGGEQEQWRSIAVAWEKMGLLRRSREKGSYRLALSPLMDEVVRAKCASCGEIAQAAKARFLEQWQCLRCNATGMCIILAEQETN